MDKMLTYKSIFNSIKDVDEKNGIITGYLSDFDTKDHDDDIIVKGAYTKSIKENKEDIYFLNQHNWAQPHGFFNTLEEHTKGLYFESTPLIKGVSYSDDAIKLYAAGVVKEHSIGFITMQSEKSKTDNARIIKEIKLFEGSNVTLGSNSNTPFTGFKNRTLEELNNECTLLYKAIKNGTFRDETFKLLEFALKDLQAKAFELGKKALTNEPLKSTQENSKPQIADIINNFTKSLK